MYTYNKTKIKNKTHAKRNMSNFQTWSDIHEFIKLWFLSPNHSLRHIKYYHYMKIGKPRNLTWSDKIDDSVYKKMCLLGLTFGVFGRASSKVIRLAAVLRWPCGARSEALSGSGHCQDKDTYICYNTTTQRQKQQPKSQPFINPKKP